MSDRKARKRAAIEARRAAAKARLATPATPPTVPVALPWKRTLARGALRRQLRADEAAWSMVMSGDARDLEGSLAMAAAFVSALGPALRGRVR